MERGERHKEREERHKMKGERREGTYVQAHTHMHERKQTHVCSLCIHRKRQQHVNRREKTSEESGEKKMKTQKNKKKEQ